MRAIRDLLAIFYEGHLRDREKSLKVKTGKSIHVMGSNIKSKNY